MAAAFPARLYSTIRPDPAAAERTVPVTPAFEPENRTEDRQAVSACAMVVSNRSELQPVSIADLTRHGCRLKGDCETLRPGQFITVKIGKFERLAAIVRWSDGVQAGVEFTRALDAHAFESYMSELAPE